MKCGICGKETPIVEHHIHSISKGGENKPYNIAKICPNCHSLVHYGKIIIEGKFRTTGGLKIIHRNLGEPSITGLEDPPVWIYSDNKQERSLYVQ